MLNCSFVKDYFCVVKNCDNDIIVYPVIDC
jgi:hypothetical protein